MGDEHAELTVPDMSPLHCRNRMSSAPNSDDLLHRSIDVAHAWCPTSGSGAATRSRAGSTTSRPTASRRSIGRGAQSLTAQTPAVYGAAFSACYLPPSDSSKCFFKLGVPSQCRRRRTSTPATTSPASGTPSCRGSRALVFERNAVVELDRSRVLFNFCRALASNDDNPTPAIRVLHDVGGRNIGFRRDAC